MNRVQVLFNDRHKPYLYGAIHIVDGNIDNQWWEKPFVISKRRADGETFYGTVARTLTKLRSQLARLVRFRIESEQRLSSAGISPVGDAGSELPDSPLTDQILAEQEDLIEEVLLSISVPVRVLSEIFRSKMKKAKVNVYDYDGNRVCNIELSKIADLLLHQRYLVVRDEYVVDLISDARFMADTPQMGLKISFPEYTEAVQRALDGLTVNDLVGALRSATRRLSSSSSIKDIVFLTQNLYTLGGFLVEEGSPIASGPLKVILDRVATQVAKKRQPHPRPGSVQHFRLMFRAPRLQLEPDLNDKQIRVTVEVNGTTEKLSLGYEDFFSEVSTAHGNTSLMASLSGRAPQRRGPQS